MNTTLLAMHRLYRLASFRVVLVAAIISCAGCGQHLTGSLRVSEGLGAPQQEGTLILVEVITPLASEQVLTQFRQSDLQAVGLKESDVQAGTAVFVSPWRQHQSALAPARGVYALVNLNAESLNSGSSTCNPRGCSYGGDAVAIRVAKRPPGGTGESVLYVVESIVEPRHVQGDCHYLDRGGRPTLYCKSLASQGWEWQDDLFIKRPTSGQR